MGMPEFKARILKIGINPYVAVPARVSRFFKRTGYVPVTVHFSGGEVRSTLVPVGEGRHRLFINGIMRRLASVDVGDLVAIRLVHDKNPRTQRMPRGLSVALGKLPWARKNWDKLRPSRRKEILMYLNHAKRPETLARNVAKVVAGLGAKGREGEEVRTEQKSANQSQSLRKRVAHL